MTTEHMTGLDGLGRTAWLTAYAHCVEGPGAGLARPVSEWLVATAGAPPFRDAIQAMTLHGIALRAKRIDDWVDGLLSAARESSGPVDVVSLGAGFDSRWSGRLDAAAVRRWIEVDRSAVVAAKRRLFVGSPFEDAYGRVETLALDLVAQQDEIARLVTPGAIVIAEGVLDYIPRQERERLLRTLAGRPIRALICDAQNAFMMRLANRRAAANTGDEGVSFSWAPRDPRRFAAECGFRVEQQAALTPALLRRAYPLAFPLLQAVPPMRNGYRVMQLAPAGTVEP